MEPVICLTVTVFLFNLLHVHTTTNSLQSLKLKIPCSVKAEYFHFGSDTQFFLHEVIFKVVCTDWRSGHQENVGTFQQDFCGSDTFFQTKNVGISSVHVFFFCLAQMMYPSFTVQARCLFRVTCKYPSINICCLQKLDSTDLDRPWTTGTYVNKTNIQCNGATQAWSLFSQMKSLQA